MMDYAYVFDKSNVQENAKSKTHLTIPVFPLSIIIIFAILFYMALYQTILISNVNHNINIKKQQLYNMDLTINNLMKKKDMSLNAETIISASRKYGMNTATSNKIKIVN